MSFEGYQIKDLCRRNIVKYTLKAFSLVPGIDDSFILDMGCGTGETVMALLEVYHCRVVAVDLDLECVSILNGKIKASIFGNRIKVVHGSIFQEKLFCERFDVVLAEGLLNIVGFEKGLALLLNHVKKSGYLIIHDQWENDKEKRRLFKKHQLMVIGTVELDENIWWKEYFSCLERLIRNTGKASYTNEKNEINEYKEDPGKCKSVIYVLRIPC